MDHSQNITDTVKESLTDLALSHASDAMTNMLTGGTIPTPIKKNVLKAFGQLCTAVVEIPVAHLEGITAEKKAETAARVKLIAKSGDQIASQMDVDPEFAQAAARKFSQKILREQVNLNKICEVAAGEISQQSTEPTIADSPAAEVPEINSDWLNSFENEANQKSSAEMQILFGRILAGEIQRPSSFSLKTVKLIGQLDPKAAALFRLLCSLCISLKMGDRVLDKRVSSLMGNAGSNSLMGYGLSFDALNILNEHGLIIADYNSYYNYGFSIADANYNVSMPFNYQNQLWGLINMSGQLQGREIRVSGVALSRAGIELSDIVDIQPDEKYRDDLLEFFKTQGALMVAIGSPVVA